MLVEYMKLIIQITPLCTITISSLECRRAQSIRVCYVEEGGEDLKDRKDQESQKLGWREHILHELQNHLIGQDQKGGK